MCGNGCPVSVLGSVQIVKRYTADCTLVFWMLDSVVDGLPGAPYIYIYIYMILSGCFECCDPQAIDVFF